MTIMEENVAITLQQLQLAIVEMGIRGRLKEEMHKVGILPLKENELTLVASNMATVLSEAVRKGTDLKAAFLEAGILPQNPKPARRVASTTVK